MKELLSPISGFPEFSPEVTRLFEWAKKIISKNYELAGFTPIETPSVERVQTLLSKGGISKQIYGIQNLQDITSEKKTKLALHFDLTVPLARYVAQHYNDLTFPFRRYQIQKVWRGERSQKGRYREFYQCDIDVIGDGSLGLLNDAEIPMIIWKIFSEMDIGPFKIRINNRKLLQGIIESHGVSNDQLVKVLNIIDDIDKVGLDKATQKLLDISLSETNINDLLTILTEDRTNQETISIIENSTMTHPLFLDGKEELLSVYNSILKLGVPPSFIQIDLGIARGLDYYTGTVYETGLTLHPEIGSICSGGRYDNLAENFTNRKLPGVGISIGLSRLLPQLVNVGVLYPLSPSPAKVIITNLDNKLTDKYMELAGQLRENGINTEVYLENKPIGKQLKIASDKGIPYAIIIGDKEIKNKEIQIKFLRTGEKIQVKNLINNILNVILD